MNRFQRQIQKKMNVFNQYFRAIKLEKPSGTPDSEIIDKAIEQYEEELDKPFPFKDCVPILHEMPKFDPMIELPVIEIDDTDDIDNDDSVTSDRKPAAVNNIGAPMGARMPRPQGSKAAKRAAREEQSLSSIESNKVVALERLAGSHELLATEIRQNNLLQRQRNDLDYQRNESERLFKMFEMWKSLGNMDECNKIMKQIQDLNAPQPPDVPVEVAAPQEDVDAGVQAPPSWESDEVEDVTPL